MHQVFTLPSTLFMLIALAGMSAPLSAAAGTVIEPVMVTIPGGEFSMGSTANPVDAGYPGSVPWRGVRINTFRLSRYETTVKQFRQFADATGHQTDGECWKLAANEWGMESGKLSWNS